MFRVTRMRRTKRLLITIISASVIASTVFAGVAFAQDSPSASAAPDKVVFTFADVSEPSSLNPMVGYLGTDYTFWALAYDIPINFSTTDFSPDYDHSIVTSVDASDDGMTFTYHFRPGVKWSDGEPFTAEDAAWTLTYYKENGVPNYSADLALMDTAVATDDTTMVLTSKKPTSFYSGESVFLYEYLLAKHIWGKFQDDYKGAKQETGFPSVGTGPYIITELRQEPVRPVGSEPVLLGFGQRHDPEGRPDHLPDLRQPGCRGRRAAVGRGRLRILLIREHPEHAGIARARDPGCGRSQLRRDRHQHWFGVSDRSRRRLQAARRRSSGAPGRGAATSDAARRGQQDPRRQGPARLRHPRHLPRATERHDRSVGAGTG